MKKEAPKKAVKTTKKTAPKLDNSSPKRYRVKNEFTLEGVIIKPNQAIMLTDSQAQEHAGSVELI